MDIVNEYTNFANFLTLLKVFCMLAGRQVKVGVVQFGRGRYIHIEAASKLYLANMQDFGKFKVTYI